MRLFERAGATAIQLEDQDFPKRCGHLDGKALIPARGDGRQDQGRARRAPLARDADRSRAPMPSRSRASSRAIERAATLSRGRRRHAVRRGAEDARRARAHCHQRLNGVPLMANMVEGGKTPPLPAAELEALGFSLVIFPGGIVRAVARTGRGVLRIPCRQWHVGTVPSTACTTSMASTT